MLQRGRVRQRLGSMKNTDLKLMSVWKKKRSALQISNCPSFLDPTRWSMSSHKSTSTATVRTQFHPSCLARHFLAISVWHRSRPSRGKCMQCCSRFLHHRCSRFLHHRALLCCWPLHRRLVGLLLGHIPGGKHRSRPLQWTCLGSVFDFRRCFLQSCQAVLQRNRCTGFYLLLLITS